MTLYRYHDGAFANTLLISYTLVVLLAAVVLGMHATWWSVLAATLLFTHVFVLLAYFCHECMHGSIFKSMRVNDTVGMLLCWLLGASYLPYSLLKAKHLRHHSERCDVLTLDYQHILQKHPALKKAVQLAQAMHLPAVEILTHCLSMSAAFIVKEYAQYRYRSVYTFISRLCCWALIAMLSLPLLLSLAAAHIFCYLILGFMDAFQHTYTVKYSLSETRSRPDFDRDYEEAHTYSNLLSNRFTIVNMLVLNFCYHNVHHWRSGEPWHRLPALHKKRYPNECSQQVEIATQLRNFHTYRCDRININASKHIPAADIGAAGVSFLVGI